MSRTEAQIKAAFNNLMKATAANIGKHPSQETKDKIGKANKGKKHSEEHRRKNAEAHKKENMSPTTIAKMSESAKRRYDNPLERKRRSDISIQTWSNPEGRKQMSIIKKQYHIDHPEKAKEISQINKILWSNPEKRNKQSLKRKKYFENPINRKKNGVASKKNWENFQFQVRQFEKGTGEGCWYGHKSLNKTRIVYCEIWKDVNPRVHARYNYKCCLCGCPENGRSHIGHHVFYVKKACCWHSEEGIYYTNLNAVDHKENDYRIGENPNYFVILCPKCHGKTGGNFANRKKYADLFKKMIDEEYGGISYLPKVE